MSASEVFVGAGWTLAVVHADPSQPLRNLTLFTGGAQSLRELAPLIEVSGFVQRASLVVRQPVQIRIVPNFSLRGVDSVMRFMPD